MPLSSADPLQLPLKLFLPSLEDQLIILEIASNDNPIARYGVVLSNTIDVMIKVIDAIASTSEITLAAVIFVFFMFMFSFVLLPDS
jgi:hypothetical protein